MESNWDNSDSVNDLNDKDFFDIYYNLLNWDSKWMINNKFRINLRLINKFVLVISHFWGLLLLILKIHKKTSTIEWN